ncbi:hypothetical protein [Enterobacter hormaechei]|uniref:hypothetical protein n=1 Tax=Enterobacter hormaechei TaxID=158836 RepID=UPI001F2D37FE|nr:hypothetical protein [Enterobacter hormaechei]
MSNIDKQAVQAVADLKAGYTLGHADVAILNELARIALASLEADSKLSNFIATQESLGVAFERVLAENIEELYVPSKSTPPAPVADSLLSELLAIAKKAADAADECAHAEWSDDSMEHSTAIADWERRASMLQGDEPVTTAYKLPDEFDFDRFNDVVWLEAVASNPHMHSPTTSTIAMVALELNRKLADGNSPVIPDGWVILPAEPTQAMMNAWLSEVANWHGHAAGYRAMIAAAPQQEAKNV